MSARVSTASLVRHHLRSRAGGGLTVAALILVLSLLATAAPIALSALGDAALRDRLSSLGALDRDVETTVVGVPQFASTSAVAATDEIWGGFEGEVDSIRLSADPPLPDLLEPARMVAFNRDNPLVEMPRTGALTVAFDPAYDDDIRIVDGRLPEPA